MYRTYYTPLLFPRQLPASPPYAKITTMRILQINSVCTGSTGRIAAGVSRVLQESGHESLLLFGRGEPAAGVACERIESAAEFYAHTLFARLTDRQGFASTLATRRMIRRIEAFRPDVIQLHNLHGYYLDWRVLFHYLQFAGIPVVWTLHDCNAFTGHCAFFDAVNCERWRTGCGNCPQKNAYPRSWFADQSARNFSEKRTLTTGLKRLTIVTPSIWLKGLVQQSYLKEYPIRVLYNGIDRNTFHPVESDLREQYQIGSKKLVLGVANVWEPRKGLHTFVDLFERLGDEAVVALIGLSSVQQQTLPKGMIGLGRTVNANELAAWYTAADVFVNPTLEDNFPTTQIEALACGTPVVCYDTGGCTESLDDSCGVAVPKGDAPALADAILRVGSLKQEHCLRRAVLFDQRERYCDYVSLYEQICREGKA